MADLSALLGKRANEVEKPKPFPVGHYTWMIKSHAIVESSKKQTPGVEFIVNMLEAKEDVDEDLLAGVKDPMKRNQKLTFWITEDSLWRLTEFLGVLGLDVEGDQTLEELIPETTGNSFVAAIMHEVMQESGDAIAKIKESSIQADE